MPEFGICDGRPFKVAVKIAFRWSGLVLLKPPMPPSSFPEHYYVKRYNAGRKKSGRNAET
jgi:hypothetical protein